MTSLHSSQNTPSTYQQELDVALRIGREAAAVLVRHYDAPSESWEKAADNPVTHADLAANRLITESLRQAFPDDGILSEETADDLTRTTRSRVWIVDPMDGTKEFVKRIPEFAVSIALVEDGEPVVGVIVNPLAKTAVWATRNGGTFRDGKRVQVSSCAQLEAATAIASRTEISRNQFDPYEGWFKELRPVGSIAWKLACIASGDGDLNVSTNPKNEWDVCAGDLLVREAGGTYLNFEGKKRSYNQRDPLINVGTAAGPSELVKQFLARL